MLNKVSVFFCLLFFVIVAQDSATAQPRKKAGLWGSSEIASKNMKKFEKWTSMWRRHNLPRTENAAVTSAPAAPQNCRGKARLQCSKEEWEKFVSETDTSDQVALLKAVNLFMNKTAYIMDPVNWGLPDYWATPDEFFLKNGDCEDYAISKYITLKRMGVDPGKMRLVILQDENLRVAHAVLAVLVDGVYYILDNQVDAVLPDSKILHYRPVYSINESGWWLHRINRFRRRFLTD